MNKMLSVVATIVIMMATAVSHVARADTMPIERIQQSIDATFARSGMPTIPWVNVRTEPESTDFCGSSNSGTDAVIIINASPGKELQAAKFPLVCVFYAGMVASAYAQSELHSPELIPRP